MPLFTESYLKNLTRKQPLNESTKMFSETRKRDKFDIFLSHSFLDRDAVNGLFIELTNYGYTVYVDWIVDPHLDRKAVTKESAKLIQTRLKSSTTLLLAMSKNADLSKWIPWELGYVDGNTGLCALIPVTKDNEKAYKFERSEYLLLYPFIKKFPNKLREEKLWVAESDTEYVVFNDWMNNLKPYKRDVNISNL